MPGSPISAPLSTWFDTILRTLLTSPSTYTPADFDPDRPVWLQIRIRGLVDTWMARQDKDPAWVAILQVVEQGTASG
jgi:hypothetical protein